MKPILLPPNQFHRFYKGGARIDALRGEPQGEDGRPEDWVGSTATSWGSDTEGLSRLADGTILKEAIEANPEAYLGPEHVAAYGADPGLLVKLLDAGERLPVHYHPGRAFAKEHLGLRYGKTESWLILEADPGASVHVGLKEPLDAETARRWVDEQDADAMLHALHEVPVTGRRRDPRPRRHAARDRRRHPAARAAGADRPLGARRVEEVRRRRRHRAPRARLGDRARVARPRADRPRRADHAPERPAARRRPTPTSAPSGSRPGDTLDQSFSIVLVTGGEGTIGDVPVRARQHRPDPVRRRRHTDGGRRGHPLPPARPDRGGDLVSPEPLLEARKIVKSFGRVQALNGANFTVYPKEVVALVGDNGAGKSTLVKTLVGVHPPDSGEILFEGKPVDIHTPQQARAIGIETVYQDLALAAEIDPAANMFLGREIMRAGPLGKLGFLDKAEMRRRSEEAFHDLGVQIQDTSAPVANMSGGQRQGIAISRAVTWASKVVFMDEPTAALGVVQTRNVLDQIKRVRDDQGLAVVLISHNLPEIFEVADRIEVLRLGERVARLRPSEVSMEDVVSAMTGALTFHEGDER